MKAQALQPLLTALRRPVDDRRLSDQQLLERYLDQGDEPAFAALVRRHGPRVRAACRQVLTDAADIDDAFQATFLVLLDKARSMCWRPDLGGWLFGVAHRIALRARASAAARQRHEARVVRPACGVEADLSWREAVAVLHEELDRLPDRLRLPLLLCYLEGLSRDEAAQQLGWSSSTTKGRLELGRRRLRDRLARRGITLTAGLLAVLGNSAAASMVPPRLVQTTLPHGVPPIMWKKYTGLLAGLLLVALALGGSCLLAPPGANATGLAAPGAEATGLAPSAESPRPAPAAPRAKPPAAETITVRGRVLGPDGRPVAGAKLHMTLAWVHPSQSSPSPEYATTGPDGRFAFTVPKGRFSNQDTVVVALAANHGAGWVQVPANKQDDLTIRLAEDDIPITGQVVDLEGKPVPGATLTVLQINAAPKEDLGPWLNAVKAKKELSFRLEQRYVGRYTVAVPLKVTTNTDGRFKLTGVGRNRLVKAQLDGPTIASQQLHMRTRSGPTLEVMEREDRFVYGERGKVATYYGSNFRHVAAPTKPVVGVVRDRDTRKPLAGVTVGSYTRAIAPGLREGFDLVRTTTDAQGRYRLVGLPKGEGYTIVAIPDRDRSYLAIHKDVPDSPGLAPVTVDLELRRGVWIEGKITDKVTGKPVKGSVEYFSLFSNPNLRDYPGYDGTFFHDGRGVVATKEDGSYRVLGLPGPGLVAVYYLDPYLRAPDRDDEYGIKKEALSTAPYHLTNPINYGALARIDPTRGAQAVKRDVTFDPGWTFKGRVLGPDGKPLAGARSFGLTGYRWWENEGLKTAEFMVQGFNPRQPRELLFQHPEKGLVGVAQPPKKNGGASTVRLEPGAGVTGRLVDEDGKPRAGVALEVRFRLKEEREFRQYPAWSPTDQEGRFRISPLLPGYEFRLSDGKGETPVHVAPRSGQTKDLGDVTIKRFNE
jgi:RNA polymerase sigma factor (sigma-70 family)